MPAASRSVYVLSEPVGNATLGIADFQITETATTTTVIGVDAQHHEVGRLELVHGEFMPTEDFGPQYNGHVIDGRKLTVAINGLQFNWETLGYSDALHMPAIGPEGAVIAEFVDDATVRPLLQAWKIGWLPGAPAAGGETAYDEGCDYEMPGTNPTTCNMGGGTGTCPILSGTSGDISYGANTPACNGGAEWEGERLDVTKSEGNDYDGNILFFCCGSSSSGNFKAKTCAAYAGQLGGCASGDYCSACGDGGGNACVGCGSISGTYSSSCSLWTTGDGGDTSAVCHDYENCAADGNDCSDDGDCCNSDCVNGSCGGACSDIGDSCSSSEDCCDNICNGICGAQ